MRVVRVGTDPYDGVSANGWYVMEGDEALAGPFCDTGVAHRHMEEMRARRHNERQTP